MKSANTTQQGLGHAWQRRRLEVFRLFGRTCHICGQDGADTIDHLDPRKWFGTALPPVDRLRPAHRACNGRRGAGFVSPPAPSRDW